MDKNIITPVFNIIGLSFDIIGVTIVSISLLTKEHFSTLSKLFLNLSKEFVKFLNKRKFPIDSKDWFFEGILKEILAYTGSCTIEPKGVRYTMGFLFILIGFMLQIFGNLLSFVSFKNLLIFLVLIYLIFFILSSKKGFIVIFKKAFKGIENNIRGDFKKPYSLKIKLYRFTVPFFLALFVLNITFIFEISIKFLFYLFKVGKWILSIGISKKERERVKKEAYKEFEDRYGKD